MSDTKDDQAYQLTWLIQMGLFALATVCVGFAILHAFYPKRFDEKTAMFLALAMAALIIQQVSKFKGFGIELEKEVRKLKEEVTEVGEAINDLGKDVGPGSQKSIPTPEAVVRAQARGASVDPNDPNKGKFGGSPQANDRLLSAVIRPTGKANNPRCKVLIKVTSTNPRRPLAGTVHLYLHPTFGQHSEYKLNVENGVAKDEIVSYGAFTIGAIADDGETQLELDLMTVKGGTDRFYEN